MSDSNKRKKKSKQPKATQTPALSPEVLPSSQRLTGLKSYLARVSKIPVLTKEQEYKLTVRYYETRDPKIAKILIESNLRFVIKVASEYSRFNSKIMDLIQEGNVGLVKAVQEFNPYKGARLITYAVWWIRGYIQEYLMSQHSIVRLGTNKKQKKIFYQLQRESKNLENFEKRLPSIESHGLPSSEVERMKEVILKKDVSLDAPLQQGGGTTFLDLQPDSSQPLDEELSSQEQALLLRKHLKKLESHLNSKEKFIIKERLLKDPPQTLQSIADQFGVTREAIRQTEEKVIKKIKKILLPLFKKSS